MRFWMIVVRRPASAQEVVVVRRRRLRLRRRLVCAVSLVSHWSVSFFWPATFIEVYRYVLVPKGQGRKGHQRRVVVVRSSKKKKKEQTDCERNCQLKQHLYKNTRKIGYGNVCYTCRSCWSTTKFPESFNNSSIQSTSNCESHFCLSVCNRKS